MGMEKAQRINSKKDLPFIMELLRQAAAFIAMPLSRNKR